VTGPQRFVANSPKEHHTLRKRESHFSPSLKFCHLWQEKAFGAKCNMERHEEKPSEAFTSEIHYTVEIWNLVKSGHDVTTNEKQDKVNNADSAFIFLMIQSKNQW